MADIRNFKIETYGAVELTTGSGGHDIVHKYWSVPKKVIRKLVNATKQPSIKDFEDWLDGAKPKDSPVGCYSSDWWSNDD
jgi:hypothetical protein